METTLLYKILKFCAVFKSFGVKGGALVVISVPVSFGVVESFKMLAKDTEPFEIVLPIVAISACIMFYFLFFLMDFIWGLIAAKHESNNDPNWVKSNKLYSSIGKIGGLLLIDFLLICIVLFIIIIGHKTTSRVFLVLSVMLNILAILYEIHSIGENIKRKTGSKPKYLEFFDRVTTVIEDKIINKIKDQV